MPSQNKDIPHILHIFSSFGKGGVPIKICHMINHFGAGAKHTIIATNNDYSSKDIIDKKNDVIFIDQKKSAPASFIKRIMNYRSYLKSISPDLVLTYNWGAIEWALANSFKPSFRHIHVESGFGPDEVKKTLFRRNIFRRLALRNTDYICVPSKVLINICRSDWHIPDYKIHYIPNGVDIEKFANSKASYKIDNFIKQNDEIIVGTIAPLRPEKNISQMIRSFNQVLTNYPDLKTRLLIMGEGVERPKLDTLVEDLKIKDKVIFTGHISKQEQAIGACDIFAISSDTEQMPNSVNEAMAAGLPIVGFAVGDIKHMVSEENKKFIVMPNDEQAFSNAIATLALDKKQQKSISVANLQHVKTHYNRTDMCDKYATLWGLSN
jgi:L-malate glycosyltransferase